MRLGVYIGSFNPMHDGHKHVAEFVINNNYVDKVLLLPTPNYWNNQDLLSMNHRINMMKFYETENIVVDSIHNNYEFTYMLLKALKIDYPNDELFLIIGDDNITKFYDWKNVKEILQYKILVLNRNNINISDYVKKEDQDRFIMVKNFDKIDVSSTNIRKGIFKNIDINVINYINKYSLYK